MNFIIKLIKILAFSCYLIFLKIKEIATTSKTIIFVSKIGIKRVKISLMSNIIIILSFLWIASLFMQSFTYRSILFQRSQENDELNRINNIFVKEIYKMDKNIKYVENYFIENDFYGNLLAQNKYNSLTEKRKIQEHLKNLAPEDYRNSFIKISNSQSILQNIQNISKQRIENLSKILSLTKLRFFKDAYLIDDDDAENKTEISLNINAQLLKNQGGPLYSYNKPREGISEDDDILFKDKEHNYVQMLSNLEKFIMSAPLETPIKQYYISSDFGKRTDPMTKRKSDHKGTDFAGPKNEKILSPSLGVVKIAGNYGAYGKAIIINHGYGIETLFGHLKEIKVKKGQLVKRGEIIGIQGNTGRSTGEHLHYEVRYKSKPLNPIGFIRAGNKIKQYYQ